MENPSRRNQELEATAASWLLIALADSGAWDVEGYAMGRFRRQY